MIANIWHFSYITTLLTVFLLIFFMRQSHIYTYLFCLFFSMFFVFVVVYLFTPFQSQKISNISSSIIPPTISNEVTIIASEDIDEVSRKRMRYTKLLLNYQKKIAQLKNVAELSPEQSLEIEQFEARIEQLNGLIADLSQ